MHNLSAKKTKIINLMSTLTFNNKGAPGSGQGKNNSNIGEISTIYMHQKGIILVLAEHQMTDGGRKSFKSKKKRRKERRQY